MIEKLIVGGSHSGKRARVEQLAFQPRILRTAERATWTKLLSDRFCMGCICWFAA